MENRRICAWEDFGGELEGFWGSWAGDSESHRSSRMGNMAASKVEVWGREPVQFHKS